jgi:predicted RNA binding protein YcfA (HicA-like mRNA interferase family)
VAGAQQIVWRQPGTSHLTFRHPNGAKLTVPARRRIKPLYIKKFVRLIDEGVGE